MSAEEWVYQGDRGRRWLDDSDEWDGFILRTDRTVVARVASAEHAPLIAAAPALRAVLARAVDALRDYGFLRDAAGKEWYVQECDWWDEMIAALAKAGAA